MILRRSTSPPASNIVRGAVESGHSRTSPNGQLRPFAARFYSTLAVSLNAKRRLRDSDTAPHACVWLDRNILHQVYTRDGINICHHRRAEPPRHPESARILRAVRG